MSVANLTHVTAVSDFGRCTSAIVVRFVAMQRAGDTSCAAKYRLLTRDCCGDGLA